MGTDSSLLVVRLVGIGTHQERVGHVLARNFMTTSLKPSTKSPKHLSKRRQNAADGPRVIVTARIQLHLRDALLKQARKRRMRSLSDMMETVVAEWLESPASGEINDSR